MKKKTKVSRKKAIKIDETTKKMKGIRSVKKKNKNSPDHHRITRRSYHHHHHRRQNLYRRK